MGDGSRYGKINAWPFQHQGRNGVNLLAERCDFTTGVKIEKPKGISDAKFASDLSEIFGFHATVILPDLNGFQGYGAFGIKVEKTND